MVTVSSHVAPDVRTCRQMRSGGGGGAARPSRTTDRKWRLCAVLHGALWFGQKGRRPEEAQRRAFALEEKPD